MLTKRFHVGDKVSVAEPGKYPREGEVIDEDTLLPYDEGYVRVRYDARLFPTVRGTGPYFEEWHNARYVFPVK